MVRDLALTSLSVSPNPVRKGQAVTFYYTVTNQGNIPEANVMVQLTYSGKPIGSAQKIAVLDVGKSYNGQFSFTVPSTTPAGDYLFTGYVGTVQGESNIENNKMTVKLTVKKF